MPGQLEKEEKEKRRDILLMKQSEISLETGQAKVGRTITVLTEGYDDESEQFCGRSEADSVDVDGKVYFTAEDQPEPGTFVKVRITDCTEYDLFGESI